MNTVSYSRIDTTLDSNGSIEEKVKDLCQLMRVKELGDAIWPVPQGDREELTRRRIDMFMAEAAVHHVETGITPDMLKERINYAFVAISSYVTDKRLLTPLVILWAAGRMSRMGMEPGLCFTQILQYMYNGEERDQHKYDLKYAFRDADVLRAFKEVQGVELIDPIVKRDFLLSMKQILTYLKDKDRDFRKELTLTQVEKYL